MRDDGMLDSLLQKVDGILAQQANPPPTFLGTYSAPEMVPTSAMVQDGPQAAHVRSSTNKSDQANNSLSSADAAYNTPEAELLNLNGIISGNNDFGYDALYSAMSILGDEWFPGLPDGMGILSAGSMP
ncbi:hypothetical protein INS49_007196 [Diaporthe citri]|uniref:uncharacterized protein n=1 Tax=Diaporthe citri TaxID=83186 RepID=UPI001C81ABAD|nr:uncharacterized protein INS49_007196 [Diaporthe citri]KAG6365585.1 hypothetical protein INS49_007196 [Diaporthe citri]